MGQENKDCPYCGEIIKRIAKKCKHCGEFLDERMRRDQEERERASRRPDPSLAAVIPVGRAPSAIAAGYLGLLSPLIIFAPFALLVGILALNQMKKDPELTGAGRAWFGIIMGAIFSLAFVAMLLPNLMK